MEMVVKHLTNWIIETIKIGINTLDYKFMYYSINALNYKVIHYLKFNGQ